MKNLDEYCFTGIANATGVIDRGGDVIAPGAFADALPAFLKTGFITFGHDWDSLPVALPIAAVETVEGLQITGRFHATANGDAARTVVAERLAQGLDVGLSIGFRTDTADCMGFRSSVALLDYALRNNVGGLDEAGIRRWRAPCRLVRRVVELFEVSIVSVPMNPQSRVQKSADLDELRAERQRLILRLTRERIAVN